MVNHIESSAVFYLQREHVPYHPELTQHILACLGDGPISIPLKGDRTGSGDLLVERTNSVDTGILIESCAPYMERWQTDLEVMIRRIETSDQKMNSLILVIPTLELRDDRPVINAEPLAQLLTERIAWADKKNMIVTIAIWDPHSAQGIDTLKDAFAAKKQGVTIIPLTAVPLFAREHKKIMDHKDPSSFIVFAADFGTLHRCMIEARIMGLKVVLAVKGRPKIGEVEFHGIYMADPVTGLAVPADPSILNNKEVILPDDQSATSHTLIDLVKKLQTEYSIRAAHIAFTHTPYTQPQATENLGKALRECVVDTAMVTDTLPSHADIPGVHVLSVAKPTATLIRLLTGYASKEEVEYVKQFLYNPGPIKEDVKRMLEEGTLPLDPSLWPYNGTYSCA